METGIVFEARQGSAVARDFDLFLHEAGIEIVSVDETQAAQARSAFRQYGKGRHPAGLNFGDCFTHALAVVSGEPILAKGDYWPKATNSGARTCKLSIESLTGAFFRARGGSPGTLDESGARKLVSRAGLGKSV